MKSPKTPPTKPCPDTQFLKAFSHAFGSGALIDSKSGESETWRDNLLRRLLHRISAVYARMIWRRAAIQCQLDPTARLGYGFQINNDGPAENVTIGANCIVRGILHASRGGKIHIGEGVYIGDNTIIYSTNSIKIGTGVMIAHDVNIYDNDTHHKDWTLRKTELDCMIRKVKPSVPRITSAPVFIGDYCWIAAGAFVFKGCTIGEHSIVGAGSVVTKDVSPDSVAYSHGALSTRTL